MKELNPDKLHVRFLAPNQSQEHILPRKYTLTHSDLTGDLFLSIGPYYDRKQIGGFYTRLMRDEVLAELKEEDKVIRLQAYCHVSGGIVIGNARWRNDIFHHHMRLVLESLHYGDRNLLKTNPELEHIKVWVHFKSNHEKYDKNENWGCYLDFA
ncbi:staygreen family protein [Chloroflexota bacterium]